MPGHQRQLHMIFQELLADDAMVTSRHVLLLKSPSTAALGQHGLVVACSTIALKIGRSATLRQIRHMQAANSPPWAVMHKVETARSTAYLACTACCVCHRDHNSLVLPAQQ